MRKYLVAICASLFVVVGVTQAYADKFKKHDQCYSKCTTEETKCVANYEKKRFPTPHECMLLRFQCETKCDRKYGLKRIY